MQKQWHWRRWAAALVICFLLIPFAPAHALASSFTVTPTGWSGQPITPLVLTARWQQVKNAQVIWTAPDLVHYHSILYFYDANGRQQMPPIQLDPPGGFNLSNFQAYYLKLVVTYNGTDTPGTVTVTKLMNMLPGDPNVFTSDTVPVPAVTAAPGGLTATPGVGTATLSWTGLADATGYHVYTSSDGGTTWQSPIDAGANTTYTLQGLTGGQPYMVAVTGYNSASEGPKTTPVSVTPLLPPYTPATPTGLQVQPVGQYELAATWTLDTNPSATGYTLTVTGPNGYTSTANLGMVSSYNLKSLQANSTYQFSLMESGTGGNSPATTASASTAPPPPKAPAQLQITPDPSGTNANATWQPDPDSTITGYALTLTPDSGTPKTAQLTKSSTYLLTSLTPNTHYTVTLVATATQGNSQTSTVAFTTPAPPPGAPSGLNATVSTDGTSATLTWQADPNPLVTGYKLTVTPDGGQPAIYSLGLQTSYKLANLTASTHYTVSLMAISPQGPSAPATCSLTTPAPPPPSDGSSLQGALPIGASGQVSGTLASNATLYYLYTPQSDGVLSLDLKAGPAQVLTLQLLDGSGATLSSSRAGLRDIEALDYPVKAGQPYYVALAYFEGRPSAFELHAQVNPPDQSPDPYEPNNTQATAAPLPATSQVHARISDPSGNDFYRLTATQNGMLTVDLKVPAQSDLDLYVHDASGNVLAASTNPLGMPEHLTLPITTGQDLFFEVRYYSGQTPAAYTLQASLAPTDSSHPSESEPNSTRNQATPFVSGITGQIADATDTDYYRWTAATSSSTTIRMTVPPNADLDMEIQDAAGNVIARSTNGLGMAEACTITPTAGSTYYVRVYYYSGSTPARYALTQTGP